MVHAAVLRGAPHARIVDLTHQVPPHDVRAGALTLWRAVPWLVPGVILAVVDPGVGTDRRAVAIEVAAGPPGVPPPGPAGIGMAGPARIGMAGPAGIGMAGPAGVVLVGPDNGLLLPAALRLAGGRAGLRAVELPRLPAGQFGATFAGRDVFGPAAARAAAGIPLAHLGQPIDPASLVGEAVSGPVREADGALLTEVLWVDRYGNAQLNATVADAVFDGGRPPDSASVAGSSEPVPLHLATAYADIPADGVGLVVDSYGLVSLACRQEPAAARLGLSAGAAVRLFRAPGLTSA